MSRVSREHGGPVGHGAGGPRAQVSGAADPQEALCFAAGTPIQTPKGPRPVETLRAGDLVMTSDLGAQPVMCVATSVREISATSRPVHIPAGALDNRTDIFVAQTHRIALDVAAFDIQCDHTEVLITAEALTGYAGIALMPASSRLIHYVHVVLDHHALLFSAGLMSESFYVSAQNMAQVSDLAHRRICAGLAQRGLSIAEYGPVARRVVRRFDVPVLPP